MCAEKLNFFRGPDSIYLRVLKELRMKIAKCLTVGCNLSPNTTSISEDWKVASVIPIFIKGSRGDPGNYGPMSLSSLAGKLVETMKKNCSAHGCTTC